ncbi:MAG: helix-turn-helix domain-containing protein [Rhodobacteraceae bacterium]|nr:helix-turn-helix domain-containing protein [Paracoccaceae bacterium]
MTQFHYTECGLQNVYINGLEPVIDDEGDEVLEIRFINALHAEISIGIINHSNGISGPELRYLRTEMGYTQAELSEIVQKDKQTIGRWERVEIEIDSASETVIRLLAIEKLKIPYEDGIEAIARKSVASAKNQTIHINAESDGYRLEAA